MGIFDKELGPDHPIYHGGILVSGMGATKQSAPTKNSDEDNIPKDELSEDEHSENEMSDEDQAYEKQREIEELTAELDYADAEKAEQLIAAGADPLGGKGLDDPGYWALCANEDNEAATVLLWHTLKAIVNSREEPPARGEIVWLSSPWECRLEDEPGELLISVTDGYSSEAKAALYRITNPDVLNGEYRIYYEFCHDGSGVGFDYGPRVCAFAREPRKRQGHALDREVAKWSAEKGMISMAGVRLDLHFEDVKHYKDGPFRRFAKLID